MKKLYLKLVCSFVLALNLNGLNAMAEASTKTAQLQTAALTEKPSYKGREENVDLLLKPAATKLFADVEKEQPFVRQFAAAPNFLEYEYADIDGYYKTKLLSGQKLKNAKLAFDAAFDKKWDKAIKHAKKSDPIVEKIVRWYLYKNAKKPNLKNLRNFVYNNPNWPHIEKIFARVEPNAKPKNTITNVKNKVKQKAKSAYTTYGKKSWRRIANKARENLKYGRPQEAYNLVKDQYLFYTGGSKADAYFLSGWIALRFLDRPEPAAAYFANLYKDSGFPISKGRGAYWAGRAYKAAKKPDLARQWFQVAASYYTTFYGQLALQELFQDKYYIRVNYNKRIIPQSVALDFLDNDLIKAARMLYQCGHSYSSRLFVSHYLETETNKQKFHLLNKLGQESDTLNWSVIAGKKAALEQLYIFDANYPVYSYTAKITPEKPLVMALMRQESEFDKNIKSHAGATGLMQIMPGTAQMIAKELGRPYNQSSLKNPRYNIDFGSYYLDKRIKQFGGSYIMAIAAYNAGAHRVDKWLETYGDPRSMDLYSAIDWMESIPYSETRNYVQRVLENTQVYRAVLNGGSHKLDLIKDVQRGAPKY